MFAVNLQMRMLKLSSKITFSSYSLTLLFPSPIYFLFYFSLGSERIIFWFSYRNKYNFFEMCFYKSIFVYMYTYICGYMCIHIYNFNKGKMIVKDTETKV